MVRTSASLLLTVLALAGCGLVDHSYSEADDDTPPAANACEGIQCGPCAPALSLKVYGEAGKPAPEVTLTGINGSCGNGAQSSYVYCWLDVRAPGDYAFEVHAPGYKTVSVQQTVAESIHVGGCCNCGYQAQEVDITLERL